VGPAHPKNPEQAKARTPHLNSERGAEEFNIKFFFIKLINIHYKYYNATSQINDKACNFGQL
jgi:hypothetical protein